MTVQELVSRVGWAFERSWNLVLHGNFHELVLSDIGIVTGSLILGIGIVKLLDGILS